MSSIEFQSISYLVSSNSVYVLYFLKKDLNESRPSEHPLIRRGTVRTFRWNHRLQIRNLFMAFERVFRW